jgi:hypothetical protein
MAAVLVAAVQWRQPQVQVLLPVPVVVQTIVADTVLKGMPLMKLVVAVAAVGVHRAVQVAAAGGHMDHMLAVVEVKLLR